MMKKKIFMLYVFVVVVINLRFSNEDYDYVINYTLEKEK
jgi:hypothetical protein